MVKTGRQRAKRAYDHHFLTLWVSRGSSPLGLRRFELPLAIPFAVLAFAFPASLLPLVAPNTIRKNLMGLRMILPCSCKQVGDTTSSPCGLEPQSPIGVSAVVAPSREDTDHHHSIVLTEEGLGLFENVRGFSKCFVTELVNKSSNERLLG